VQEIAAKTLPPGYAVEWSSGSYQEIKAGRQSIYIIGFGLIMVFLVLAAQYEKWSLPFAVLLAVPFGAFGAIVSVFLRKTAGDIYFQIGLLTLIGLAAKNAILIVEFCSKMREQGQGIVEAALRAARIRLRPIVMTSLAFILGVLPLVLSTGAGAAGRHSIGTSVMGGMLSATFLAVFFVPFFFVVIQWISELGGRHKKAPVITEPTGSDGQEKGGV
jgi:multidrug efflux pump